MHRFKYEWTLKNAVFAKDKGKVFSCFACGGGSTMGYKLAGFDVIGCNEIDPKLIEIYKKNHNPNYAFCEPIQTFKKRDDLPKELYELDILDGSPPCSSFSMVGNREKDWGKNKKFREGQTEQVLDTLFFDFIDLADKLQPKVVVAENVKGLLIGNAIDYVRRIYDSFDKAGYYCQHWLLNAADMGVPQKRERVFFVCLRKDLAKQFLVEHGLFDTKPEIKLSFSQRRITFSEIKEKNGVPYKDIINCHKPFVGKVRSGDNNLGDVTIREVGVKKYFNTMIQYDENPCYTVVAHTDNTCMYVFSEKRYLTRNEFLLASSFPLDYDFGGNNVGYVCGMCVPPLMVANIASEIYDQWLSKI